MVVELKSIHFSISDTALFELVGLVGANYVRVSVWVGGGRMSGMNYVTQSTAVDSQTGHQD